jgi:hypothetical protein
MTYAAMDPVIDDWAKKRGILVSREEREPHRRFFHVSSPAAETFQVVIEPERRGQVRIDAHLIETGDDEEVHYVWEVPVARLRHALDRSAGSIGDWFNRTRR